MKEKLFVKRQHSSSIIYRITGSSTCVLPEFDGYPDMVYFSYPTIFEDRQSFQKGDNSTSCCINR